MLLFPLSLCQVRTPVGTIYLDPKLASQAALPRQMAWSRAVCSKLKRDDPVSIEGPFGGLSFDPKDVHLVICIVGGSGLTVGLSVAQYIDSACMIKENEKSVAMAALLGSETSVAMVWSVNTTEDPIKLASIFSDLSDRTTVAVHRTTNNTLTESGIVLAGAVAWGSTGGHDTGTAAVSVMDGRVNFITYLSQFKNAGDVGIVICGPPSFTLFAIEAAEDFAERSTGNVFMSVESFCT
jgi:NAD(P)H-flavin reductase